MIGVLRYVSALAVCTAIHGGRIIIASLFGVKYRPGGVYDRAPRDWGRQILGANGVPLYASGLDRIPAGSPCVYACNHTSFVDIWALLAVLPGSVRFVAKRELLSIPFFGRALKASGQIPINRRNLRDAFAAYDEAAAAIRSGISAIVFVEGTRSRDGSLAEFKKGPFVLAIRAEAPIVPVYVSGAHLALPPGSWQIRRVPVHVRVGMPISTAGRSYDDREHLVAEARSAMESLRHDVDALGGAH